MGIEKIALFARTTVWPNKPIDGFNNVSPNIDRYDEDYEMTKNGDKKITSALKKLMHLHGIKVYSFDTDDPDEKGRRILQEADEVILAVDARVSGHADSFRCAKKFLNYTEPGEAAPWAPYLLLTNADLVSPKGRQNAADIIRECWLMWVPSLSEARCSYPVIYCAHDYNHFSMDGEHYEEGIDIVVNYMTEQQDYWNKHRKWAQGLY